MDPQEAAMKYSFVLLGEDPGGWKLLHVTGDLSAEDAFIFTGRTVHNYIQGENPMNYRLFMTRIEPDGTTDTYLVYKDWPWPMEIELLFPQLH